MSTKPKATRFELAFLALVEKVLAAHTVDGVGPFWACSCGAEGDSERGDSATAHRAAALCNALRAVNTKPPTEGSAEG